MPASYDGKTSMGPWANMCEDHFQSHGTGLGTGRGQRLIQRGTSRRQAGEHDMYEDYDDYRHGRPFERDPGEGHGQHRIDDIYAAEDSDVPFVNVDPASGIWRNAPGLLDGEGGYDPTEDPDFVPAERIGARQQRMAARFTQAFNMSDDTYRMVLSAMSRKHYQQVAEAISSLPPQHRPQIAASLADMFKADNPGSSISRSSPPPGWPTTEPRPESRVSPQRGLHRRLLGSGMGRYLEDDKHRLESYPFDREGSRGRHPFE